MKKAVTPEALLQSMQFPKPAESPAAAGNVKDVKDPLWGKKRPRIENVMVRISEEEGKILQRIATAINAQPEWGRGRNPAYATILRAGLRLIDPEAGYVDIAKSASLIAETAAYKRRGT